MIESIKSAINELGTKIEAREAERSMAQSITIGVLFLAQLSRHSATWLEIPLYHRTKLSAPLM